MYQQLCKDRAAICRISNDFLILITEGQTCNENRIETEKDLKNNSSQVVGNRFLSGDRPSCKLFTEFPFEDLTTVTKDITCTKEMIISPATINDTGIYTCRNKISFKTIGEFRQNITIDGNDQMVKYL